MTEPTLDHSAFGARLLAWPAVRQRVGISRTTAWRLQNEGAFPLPVVISPGRVGWREDEIEAWAESLRKRLPRKSAQPSRKLERQPGSGATPPGQSGPRPRGADAQLGFDF